MESARGDTKIFTPQNIQFPMSIPNHLTKVHAVVCELLPSNESPKVALYHILKVLGQKEEFPERKNWERYALFLLEQDRIPYHEMVMMLDVLEDGVNRIKMIGKIIAAAQKWETEEMKVLSELMNLTHGKHEKVAVKAVVNVAKLMKKPITEQIAATLMEMCNVAFGLDPKIKAESVLYLTKAIIPYLPSHYCVKLCNLLLNLTGKVQLAPLAYHAFNNLFCSTRKPLPPKSMMQILQNLFIRSPKDPKTLPLYLNVLTNAVNDILQEYPEKNILLQYVQKFLVYFERSENSLISLVSKNMKDTFEKHITKEWIKNNSEEMRGILNEMEEAINARNRQNISVLFSTLNVLFRCCGAWCNLDTILNRLDVTYQSVDITLKSSIEKAFGGAIYSMGIERFLKSVPIGNPDNPRFYLLRIMRSNLTNNRLVFFKSFFHPKITQLKEQTRTAPSSEIDDLIDQIWYLLPRFFEYPKDLPKQFNNYFSLFMGILENNPQRRDIVCRSLIRLIETNQSILSGEQKIPSFVKYSKETAERDLNVVSEYATQFLPALFAIFEEDDDTNFRNIVGKSISLLASISQESVVEKFLKRALASFLVAEKNNQKEKALNMLDIVSTMIPNATTNVLVYVLKTIGPLIASSNTKIQKRAYRIICLICENHQMFLLNNGDNLLPHIIANMQNCHTSSKPFRLRIFIQMIDHMTLDVIKASLPQFMAESLLSLKESSKAGKASVELLDRLIKRIAFENSEYDLQQGVNPEQQRIICMFFNQYMLGSLGGSSDEMISSTIKALHELLFDYADIIEPVLENIVESVFLLLKFNSKQVIKATLGFVKMALNLFQPEFLKQYMPDLVKDLVGVLKVQTSGNTLGTIKILLERMIRKFDYDYVYSLVPEDDRKLIKWVNHRLKHQKKKDKKAENQPSEYVFNDDDIVDFNDPRALGKIGQKQRKSKIIEADFEMNEDGKMVIEMEKKSRKRKRSDATETLRDDYDDSEKKEIKLSTESNGKPTAKILDMAGHDKLDDNSHDAHYLEIKKRKIRSVKRKIQLGQDYRPKRKGTGGDIKKRNKPDPYAYLPLDPQELSKKNRKKDTVFDKFHTVSQPKGKKRRRISK